MVGIMSKETKHPFILLKVTARMNSLNNLIFWTFLISWNNEIREYERDKPLR